MRENHNSIAEIFWTGRLEWNHLSLTGPKKKRKWRNSFAIFMPVLLLIILFLSRLRHNFFSQVNSNERVLPDDEFFKTFILQFLKKSVKMQI